MSISWSVDTTRSNNPNTDTCSLELLSKGLGHSLNHVFCATVNSQASTGRNTFKQRNYLPVTMPVIGLKSLDFYSMPFKKVGDKLPSTK